MAAALAHLPLLAKGSIQMRAQSKRLREEMIKVQLDLSFTIIKFAYVTGNSEELRRKSYGAARNGYEGAVRLLGSERLHSKSIEDTMRQLQSALMGLAPDKVESPPTVTAKKSSLTPEHLTQRETQVLKCIAEGQSTKELADNLGITFKTAACHRERIMQKLAAPNAAMVVRWAIRAGLVDP